MPQITQKSKDYLMDDIVRFLRDDYDELAKIIEFGFKAVKDMSEDELLALFQEYGVTPEFETSPDE